MKGARRGGGERKEEARGEEETETEWKKEWCP